MNFKILTIPVLLLTVFFLLPCLAHAQPTFSDDVSDAPIDGGLSLLLAAGVGFGSRKLNKARAKSNLRRIV